MLLRVRWGRLPLTQRLTLLFTAVAASVVLGLGALFLVETERHFVELDRVALQDKQHLIEDILRNANSADDARRRLGEALSYHHDLYAQVQDGQGAVVFQSRGFISTMRGDKSLRAGENKVFVPAKAFITNTGITLFAPSVAKPVAVRYAFDDFVVGELFNTEGLPASSFRTDTW